MEALTAGKACKASTAALTKKLMKPRPTPCFFWKVSLYLTRRAMTALQVRFVERRQDGGVLLGGEQSFGDARPDGRHPFAAFAARWGRWRLRALDHGCGRWSGRRRFLGGGAALLKVAEHVFLDDTTPAAAAGDLLRIDPLVGRDVPRRRRQERLRPRAASGCRRTDGGQARLPSPLTGEAGCGAEGAACPTPSSIWPITAPMATFCPSATVMLSRPPAGAITSVVALSVSSSHTGSLAFTAAPFAFSQRAMVPSVTTPQRRAL